jgi:predicted translin family RNA/ssDNA-binding protein
MIDKTLFNGLRKELETYDKLREELIRKSRDVLKIAKLLIYSIHRKNEVEKNLATLKKEKKLLDAIIKKDKNLLSEGSYSEAIQEYTEALTYYHFVKDRKLITPKQIGASTNDYLMGLCDLTGELARKSVMCAIDNDEKTLTSIHKFCEEIFIEFMKFSFRNGHLRKKSDQIKWNLKKIEEVVYDMKMKR